MKLFTLFFYTVGALYLLLMLSFFTTVNFEGILGLIIILLPALTIASPAIALAGFIYAYKERDHKLLLFYMLAVVIPVNISTLLWIWNII